MQLIAISLFCYLFLNAALYAADTPIATVSHVAEKTEEISQDNNVLTLTFGDGRTRNLTMDNTEGITLDTYKDIVDQYEKKGLPALFISFTYKEKDKETNEDKTFDHFYDFYTFYIWTCTPQEENSDNGLIDPNTQLSIKDFNDLHVFLVRNRGNTNHPQYEATFIGNCFQDDKTEGNQTEATILMSIYSAYLKKQTGPILRKASFYTHIAKRYTHKYNDLAFKFAQFALEGIPENVQTSPEADEIIKQKIWSLRLSGYFCKEKGDIPLAIQYYKQAIDFKDLDALRLLQQLYLTQRNLDYTKDHIQLIERITLSSKSFNIPLQERFKRTAKAYEKQGNQEAVDLINEKIKDLNENHPISDDKKRERPNTPEQEEIIQPANKRVRESSPE